VLERVSAERNAPLTIVGREVRFEAGEHCLDGQSITIFTPEPLSLRIPLLGEHQAVNAATAYAALKASGLPISKDAIRKGFGEVSWPCRFEIVQREPPVILDSAHNPDSFEKLAQTLEDYFPGRPVILIFGSSEDKDMAGMLKPLKKQLSLVLATTASPVETALARALELAAGENKVILSAGSMFVTAEVKTAWQKLNKR
jgi:dihydrofolate synthase/folylpolyglutamate synthase